MRVLAINDLSCVGKCSLTVTLPILSACGVECNVLPTAILSTHTGGFTGYTFHDLTGELPAILAHWKSLGLKFDFVYSGYLGSIDQIELVSSIKKEFLAENGKFIVDPVMGDEGKLYAGFTAEYVEAMKALCAEADYILPNATEAAFLSGVEYPLTKGNVGKALEELGKLSLPIITGVKDGTDICVFFSGKNGGKYSFTHENVEGFFCGAGDVFASAFVACLARGKHTAEAIYLASEFATAAIRRSAKEVPDKKYGLNFEAEILPFVLALQSLDKEA